MTTMCGGTGAVKDVTEDDIAIANKVRDATEGKTNRKFERYVPRQVKTQLVAGTNYFFKVEVGDGDFIHIRVFQALPHCNAEPELHGVQEGKSESDPIDYFQE